MLTYPRLDPVLFSFGPLSVRWYGVMYFIGFLIAFLFTIYRGRVTQKPWNTEDICDLFFYVALGVIFGGTLGHVLFYDFYGWCDDPLRLFKFWQPGRSFHGGLLGTAGMVFLFARSRRRSFWEVLDFLIPVVPIGLGAGRIGNFLNNELWGRVTTLPWGVLFPDAGELPRHPSQVYEFFLEGVLLFGVLQWCTRWVKGQGALTGCFLVGYGVFRSMVEFFREPDAHLGFIAFDWLTMGQLLSLPMILGGALLIYRGHRQAQQNSLEEQKILCSPT